MPSQPRRRAPRREPRLAIQHPTREFAEEQGEPQAALAREEILQRSPPGAEAQATALDRADGGTRLRAVQHCVRENVGRCIRRASRQPARVLWELDRDCLRDHRVREAVRGLRHAGLVNVMCHAV